MQIFILGMHRSGTSLLTRLLNLMGVYLGPEGSLLLPAEDNVKGFWERVEILEMHEAILERMGMSWYRVAGFNPQVLDAESERIFSIKVPQFCYNIDSHRPWALKDPRLCLFFSRWKPYLEVPLCIFMYRRPLQVARSLAKRNGFPISFGLALWEYYNIMAVRSMTDCPNMMVYFDDLMRRPVATGRKIFAKLKEFGVQRINFPSTSEIKGFISPSLIHHKIEEVEEEAYVTCRQQAIFKFLRERETLDSFLYEISPHAQETINEYQAKEDMGKKFDRQREALNSALAEKALLEEREEHFKSEKTALGELNTDLIRERNELKREIVENQKEIVGLLRNLENLRNQLEIKNMHMFKMRSEIWYSRKEQDK
jgi:hypothetical protein